MFWLQDWTNTKYPKPTSKAAQQHPHQSASTCLHYVGHRLGQGAKLGKDPPLILTAWSSAASLLTAFSSDGWLLDPSKAIPPSGCPSWSPEVLWICPNRPLAFGHEHPEVLGNKQLKVGILGIHFGKMIRKQMFCQETHLFLASNSNWKLLSTEHPAPARVRSRPYSSWKRVPFHTNAGDRNTAQLLAGWVATQCPIRFKMHGVSSDFTSDGATKLATKRYA